MGERISGEFRRGWNVRVASLAMYLHKGALLQDKHPYIARFILCTPCSFEADDESLTLFTGSHSL
jgi:hypothetical protein